jgi:hypothetical protein
MNHITGKYVGEYVRRITPNEEDVPNYFISKLIEPRLFILTTVGIQDLLESDPSFAEYALMWEDRYDYGADPIGLEQPIVVVDGEVLDGYNRTCYKREQGANSIEAYVAIQKTNESYVLTFEKFIQSTSKAVDLEAEFLEWVSGKLNINISTDTFLGSGVEGEVYAIDKFRAIKICNYNLDTYLHLVNKNIQGVAKVYHVGQMVVPKRFKGYTEQHFLSNSQDYRGINLLNPNRFYDESSDQQAKYTLNYVIMERLTVSEEIQSKIATLDGVIWTEYVTGLKAGSEENSTKRMKRNDANAIGKTPSLNKILHKYYTGFYHFFLRTIMETPSEELRADFNSFLKGNYPAYVDLANRLMDIGVEIKRNGITWDDPHGGNYALNSKGELVAFDLSQGSDKEFGHTPKNIIKECKKQDKGL